VICGLLKKEKWYSETIAKFGVFSITYVYLI